MKAKGGKSQKAKKQQGSVGPTVLIQHTQEKRVGNTAPFFARISHKDGVPYGKFTALRRVPSAPVMGTNYTGRHDGNRQFSRSVPYLPVDFPR